MKYRFFPLLNSLSFALWSLRRRTGQIVPVAISFFLLMGAVQLIGALHDISSVLVKQQIARSWRGPYDLLIRPQSAVSELERRAGWIDPQGILEAFGGISQQQVASISTIAHVVQVVPFATAGWQAVDVLLPVELTQKGVYRISAVWNGQWKTENVIVRYVDVTDLAHLTNEVQSPELDVQHLVTRDDTKPVVFTMTMQAIQAIIGVPPSQQGLLSQALLENLAPTPATSISLHVERLRGELSSLAGCIKRVDCWETQQLRQGTVSYQSESVQMLRYSQTRYAASPQQIAAGELSIVASGSDGQGQLYRVLLPEHVPIPIHMEDGAFGALSMHVLLPFSMPQRLPLMTNAVRFIPLKQACAINGERCYSGVYVRLNGIGRYSQQSLALLQATAASIIARTGLHVDILDGSSLRDVSISVLGGAHKGTISSVQSMWRVVGVAVQIEHGVDGVQAMLLAFCSMVCLLAIGAAGILVGIGRRKDSILLRQVGWQGHVLVTIFLFDGLALCGPACLLAIGWTMLATRMWAGSLSPLVMCMLLAAGALVYCCSLVLAACAGLGDSAGDDKGPRPYGLLRYLGRGRGNSSQAWRAKVTIKLASGLALISAIFLIATGYLLIISLDRILIVTILGRQVREALEGSQLLLLLIMLSAALLTVGLCAKLLLRGKREELELLSMVGWERSAVMLRIMWDNCSPALVSGEIGVLLAIAVTTLVAAFPPLLTLLSLLVCGPLLGMLLAGLATIGIAWQETGRAFRWR